MPRADFLNQPLSTRRGWISSAVPTASSDDFQELGDHSDLSLRTPHPHGLEIRVVGTQLDLLHAAVGAPWYPEIRSGNCRRIAEGCAASIGAIAWKDLAMDSRTRRGNQVRFAALSNWAIR